MLDESIMQLLEASKTVPVYTRENRAVAAEFDEGHFNCHCPSAPLSAGRLLKTTVIEVGATDGCVATIGFVWSEEDAAWLGPLSPLRHIIYESWEEELENFGDEWLDEDFFVRITSNNEGEVVHSNRRVTLGALLGSFLDDDHTIQTLGTVSSIARRGVYIAPETPYNVIRRMFQTRDTPETQPYTYATEQGARLLKGPMTRIINLTRLDLGDEGDVRGRRRQPLVGADMGRITVPVPPIWNVGNTEPNVNDYELGEVEYYDEE